MLLNLELAQDILCFCGSKRFLLKGLGRELVPIVLAGSKACGDWFKFLGSVTDFASKKSGEINI